MAHQRSTTETEEHVADIELAADEAEHVNGGKGSGGGGGKVSMNDLLAGQGGGGAGKVSMNDLRATRAGIDEMLGR